MKTDQEIWQESLLREDNKDLFKIKPGGPNAKPLPKREMFSSPKEKRLEERVKELETQVNNLIMELKKHKRLERKPVKIYTNDSDNRENK